MMQIRDLKLCFVACVLLGASMLSLPGCGGGKSDNQIIQEVPPDEPEMTEEESAIYAKELEKSMQ